MPICPKCEAELDMVTFFCDECGFEGEYEDFDCKPATREEICEVKQEPEMVNSIEHLLTKKYKQDDIKIILMGLNDQELISTHLAQKKKDASAEAYPGISVFNFIKIIKNEMIVRGINS